MQNMHRKFEFEMAGRPVVFETGKMAKQANASVVATYGDTVVLVTSVLAEKAREGLDFFPLLVDYEERFYSAGKIPGGFIKREGRPSETAILSGRVVDRSIRSLFPEYLRNDVHVVSTVLSVDQVNPPSVLAINAASCALTISDIPWDGPIGAVRMGCIDGKLVVNPTEQEMPDSTLDLLVAGHKGGITMVEAASEELSEEFLVDALEMAHNEIIKIVTFQEMMQKEIGKEKKIFLPREREVQIDEWIAKELEAKIYKSVQIHSKSDRADALSAITKEALEEFAHMKDAIPDLKDYVTQAVDDMVKSGLRRLILEENKRADGRVMDEVRPITCEIDVLPRTHGSALFTRGETQSLAVTTLGMLGSDDQVLDGLKHDEPSKRFILHYNFPPYSVGEVRPMRGPGRREIGHGALAEKALRPMLPDAESFPYVMRVVSDILESNGSSSMASVCGGSLSLMDAGVPMKKAVAGVAMGLVTDGVRIGVLTDIQGLEDHYGDMDFKVAGTKDGVTALQMDNKAGGITRAVLQQALEQARQGRLKILDVMDKTISEPKPDVSPNAPRILTMNIDPEKIRDVIGPGGKIIRSIVQRTGAKIDVEDDGKVYVAAVSSEAAAQAMKIIVDLTRDVGAGEVFIGKVTRLMAFGAFVEVLPGKEGLLHVSEIASVRIGKVEDALNVGDEVLVVIKEIDDMKRVNLSRKKLFDAYEKLAKDEEYAAQITLEIARNARYETLKSDEPARGGERPSYDRHDRNDRDRNDTRRKRY